jgi:hypothetical protein
MADDSTPPGIPPENGTKCTVTFELDGVVLPDDEEEQEEVAENMRGVVAYAIRNADPGFSADMSDSRLVLDTITGGEQ